MKKNKMMRIASALLVVCLLTTCMISGTFAKYTTANYGSDDARVAKFGVNIDISSNSIFSISYNNDSNAVTVEASNKNNVVAPGTSGSMADIEISGTPEVAVNVTYEADLQLDGWEDADGNYYCPLEIKVGNEVLKGMNYSNSGLFEAAVEMAIAKSSDQYDPNTVLSTDATAPSVSWSWAFDDEENEGVNDVQDTYLGDQAAAGKAAKIGLELTVTVTQID